MKNEQLRRLPSVEAVLARLRNGHAAGSREQVTEAARAAVQEARARVLAGEPAAAVDDVAERALQILAWALAPSLREVINATGVILQTNLGRAPLSERALAAMEAVSRGYSNLEFDLESGERGSRHDHLRELIRRTTGAEDGIVVNNNAAALFMVLQTFAEGREVIVSRGQAVEIGGGFRIPDVLRQSGAQLVEVGTTNRTYARDYREACTPETAAILRVHASNFRVVGFTAEPTIGELAEVAKEQAVLLFDDLGSGCLVDTTQYGMAKEPTVRESIEAGADLALFSGDKLLGGPQCGIIAGRGELIERLRRHPLARALRVDKLTIAALSATLASYVAGREAEDVPIWRMVRADLAGIRARAERWAEAAGSAGSVVEERSMVGGGSLPGEGVATWCAALTVPDVEALARDFREHDPPIVGRVKGGRMLLDPRTVAGEYDAVVVSAIRKAIG